MTREAVAHFCNILVAGGTGVGKSSLVNYLVGKDVAKVGVGRPVTSRDVVPSYACVADGITLRLFDTWGIEADKTEDWKRRIRKIVGKDGEDAAAWFHTIVYCVSCGGKRFQGIDAEMIRFFKGEGFSVVIALTKSDQASEATVKEMRVSLPKSVPAVEVSSGGVLRTGKTEPMGKEELVATIARASVGALPGRVRKFALAKVGDWERVMLARLGCKDIGRFGNGDIESWIKDCVMTFARSLEEDMKTFRKREYAVLNALSRRGARTPLRIDVDIDALKDSYSLSVGEKLLIVPLLPIITAFRLAFGAKCERERFEKMIRRAARQFRDAILRGMNKGLAKADLAALAKTGAAKVIGQLQDLGCVGQKVDPFSYEILRLPKPSPKKSMTKRKPNPRKKGAASKPQKRRSKA